MKIKFLAGLVVCLALFLASFNEIGIQDINKYERENNVQKITKILDEFKNSKPGTKPNDIDVEAAKALVRMASNNKEADEYLIKNCKSFEEVNNINIVMAPYLLKHYVRDMHDRNIEGTESYAKDAMKHIASASPEVVDKVKLILKKCDQYKESEKADKLNVENYLKAYNYNNLTELENEIRKNERTLDYGFRNIIKRTGIKPSSIAILTKEEQLAIYKTAIFLDPGLRMLAETLDSIDAKNKQLKARHLYIIRLQNNAKGSLKKQYDNIQAEIKNLQSMVLNNQSANVASKNSTSNNSETIPDVEAKYSNRAENIKYYNAPPGPDAVVKGTDVFFRSNLNIHESSVIGVLKNGEQLRIIKDGYTYYSKGSQKFWFKAIRADGTVGYVCQDYVITK